MSEACACDFSGSFSDLTDDDRSEFGPSPPKCKTWLQTAHPSLFSTLFPAEGLSEGVAALAVTGDGSDGASASAGKPKQPQGKRGAPQPPKITVKRVERNKVVLCHQVMIA